MEMKRWEQKEEMGIKSGREMNRTGGLGEGQEEGEERQAQERNGKGRRRGRTGNS